LKELHVNIKRKINNFSGRKFIEDVIKSTFAPTLKRPALGLFTMHMACPTL
jgi:hypothetical protein